MRLTHLSLHNFRNYVRLDRDLAPGVTVLWGDNAQGKTNLLEAIFYLATSRSPHAGADREVVNWLACESEPLPYARLVGRIARSEAGHNGAGPAGDRPERGEQAIEITLTREMNNGARYRKQIRLNGVPRRAMDLLGHLNVVLFLPEDIAVVHGAPGLRRRYLDVMLCQVAPPYCAALSRYNEVVAQRNALLRDLRERGGDVDQLRFWDERLVEHGSTLSARRRQTVAALDELGVEIHAALTDGAERLRLSYVPGLELPEAATAQAIAAGFRAQLETVRRREVAAGVTLLGPHRDELRFLIDGVDAGIYGSRGQQRTAALALKLAEVELMRRETGEYPVLLLDDVLSELDAHRRCFLVERLGGGPEQAIVTATDLHVFPAEFLQGRAVWHVQAGRLERTP
jgi:DNA replication and repair protein RecF